MIELTWTQTSYIVGGLLLLSLAIMLYPSFRYGSKRKTTAKK